MLLAEMKRKVGAMMNDRVPDVTLQFSRELRMDLSEVDVEARIANYFMTFDRLVEDNGLVELTHREAKVSDLALHDLMIERATRQQQYHLMQAEMKQNATPRVKDSAALGGKAQQRPTKPQSKSSSNNDGNRSSGEQRKPPRDGCLICKGPHWARDCPTASPEQKAGVENNLREWKGRHPDRVKRVTADDEPSFRTAIVNSVLTVPFCPDTGSDANIIGRPVLDELIVTAAGPLRLSNIECLVLEAPEEELRVGRATLQSIGVDLDGIFEQLVQHNLGEAEAEADEFPATKSSCLEMLTVAKLRLGQDEAADVEPLQVQLVPDAQPYRSGVRRYPEVQRRFLRDYVCELEAAGLVERNNQSRWSCPVLPVAKQGTNEFRITIDYRPLNKLTVPIAGAAPNLVVVVGAVRGAYGFGTFDFHKGFWQMPLHPNSREIFSFVTEDGGVTPTRVPQGASDSAVHFQAQMNDVLKELLFKNVLVWIDDVLLFAQTPGAFLDNLERFFSILRQRKLKLNAKKCKLFARHVKWCGKIIDGEGVAHDPERLEALVKMSLPPTGAALQHFLCALNWLRDSMVDYTRTVAPLQEKLEQMTRERSRRKSQLSGATLDWTDDEEVAFKSTLAMVERSCKLNFPKREATVCMFSDASLSSYAIVITQVRL
ncbi:hypothetical protein PHMEG_00011920 [Phytophthora megakarya]|uniref:Reverse transcriptase domain-containing protein n=1 Tax=Phytophthora megakarya TaxID=4795 RepID=A0A225WA35_9STRA|nr:hypothetical protein PHMEG_00011920 [Phytophthora megakarya]